MNTQTISLLIFGAIAVGMGNPAAQAQSKGLVVHEWGTFTSLQGSDGVPLRWSPLSSPELPKFVYNWSRAGFDRRQSSPLYGQVLTKTAVTTLQRMETPVIYFYSDRERTVDVSVEFPQGLITEWYPQAATLGPSFTPASPKMQTLQSNLVRWGIPARFQPTSLFAGTSIKQSVIGWPGIRVMPNHAGNEPLPTEASTSHYFAARETDSATLRVDTSTRTNEISEREKFLFYRGVGDFATPLTVKMPTDGVVKISNSGKEPLQRLFVLSLSNGLGRMSYVETLAPTKEISVFVNGPDGPAAKEELITLIRAAMADSLVKEGLYSREAKAMVNTWKDSWFAEDGVRVLYMLPRVWTDQTLPMRLRPAPAELVRVMVGRAEVLTPALETQLTQDYRDSSNGDKQASAKAAEIVAGLGRFGPAAAGRSLALAAAKP